MLEYSKKVLQKVSFDKALFHKELSKFMLWLSPDEANELFSWSVHNFNKHFKKSVLNNEKINI